MFGIFRFVLAINVVLFHLADVPTIGPYAVFSFFVLSGYLMTAVMNESYGYTKLGIWRFWINRWLRLYPYYWFGLILTCSGILLVTGREFALRFHQALYLPGDSMEWIQNIFMVYWAEQPISILPRLSPASWALSIELFFYLLISLGASINRMATLTWFGLSVVYAAFQALAYQNGLTYGTVIAASLPFAVGALVYHEMPTIRRLAGSNHLILLTGTLLLMVLNAVLPSLLREWAGEHHWKIGFACGYIDLVLSACAVAFLSMKKTRKKSLNRIDKYLGDLSYPIYIFHWFGACFAAYILTGTGISTDRPSLVLAFSGLLISMLSWYVALPIIVRPIDRIRNKVREHKSKLSRHNQRNP